MVVAWLNNRPFWLKAPPPIGVKVSIRFPTHPFPAKGYGGGNSRALERLSCGRWHMPTIHWQQLIRRFHHHPKRSDVRGWVVAQSRCPIKIYNIYIHIYIYICNSMYVLYVLKFLKFAASAMQVQSVPYPYFC